MGGTSFLDEIGDLPRSASGEASALSEAAAASPAGNKQELESDARIIATTNPISKPKSQTKVFGRDFMLGRLNGSPAATRLKEAREAWNKK